MFEEIFDDVKGLQRELTINKTVVPELALDDPLFFEKKPSAGSLKKSVQLQRDAFASELIGDCLPTVTKKTVELDPDVQLLLKSTKPGRKLAGTMKKLSLSVPEAMENMMAQFAEFFNAEETRILERAVKALDVPLFLTLMSEKVYAS